MSRIAVHRKKARWQDRGRDYVVFVDGKEVARVADGASCAIQVAPGPHAVHLRIDWCRSPELHVEVGQGETVPLFCGPNAHPVFAIFHILFMRNRYVWLRPAA